MVCHLGAEPDPLAYIAHLVHVFRLARPALRSDGVLWLNLGDSYASDGGKRTYGSSDRATGRGPGVEWRPGGIPDKNLLGIPQRAALALQADGWIWRSEVIWAKPNGMPESVQDRVTRAHEQVLLFGNGPQYYYDAVAVQEEASEGERRVNRIGGYQEKVVPGREGSAIPQALTNRDVTTRNRRSVWSVPTSPMPRHLRAADEAHYAAWPPALVEVMIKASTSNKACGVCGRAWVRKTEKGLPSEASDRPQARRAAQLWAENALTDAHLEAIRAVGVTDTARSRATSTGYGNNRDVVERLAAEAKAVLGGYYREFLSGAVLDHGHAPACAHGDGSARSVVLDPFAGTGTTGAVAESLGRDSILIDLGYQALQERRTSNLQISMEAFL